MMMTSDDGDGKEEDKEVVIWSNSMSLTPQGTGEELGKIEQVDEMLGKVNQDHDLLKAFHLLLYNTTGQKTTRKRDIRRFHGFPKNVS